MKYTIALSILFSCCFHNAHSQDYSRDVIITTDTVREFNNTRKFGTTTDSYIRDGIEIKIFETPFQIANITSKKMNNLNGMYMKFYLPSNMPKIKGNYEENEKHGKWYYWNEKGKLSRKETWKKGKLLEVQKY